jgi:hypothetical protein
LTDDDTDIQKQQAALKAKLEALKQEHRDLDDVIDMTVANSTVDLLKLTRLKKRKLSIKDEISYIKSKLLPDIIA